MAALQVVTTVTFSLSFLAISEGFTKGIAKTVGQPWPLPKNYMVNDVTYAVSAEKFRFTYSKSTKCNSNLLAFAFDRYYNTIFYLSTKSSKSQNLLFEPSGFKKKNEIHELEINVQGNCEKYPSLNMSEKYSVVISSPTSFLSAESEWGILRGLETFSQLIYKDEYGVMTINQTIINDEPRFAHRGAMIDTSRHFVAVPVIKNFLDLMAINKLNVFHWHVVDDQSFPYQSINFPDLSNKGAYNPYSHVYSQADVADIIEYARLRGIRVIPEFDTPGHTQSWGPGQPDLLTKCFDKSGQFDGSYGPIDPTLQSTYQFLLSFMTELTAVFKDSYLHLGGDEVDFGCWKSNPNITAFMENKGFEKHYQLLEQYYEQNLLDILNQLKHGYMIWQEVLDNGVKIRPDTVVHIWKDGYEQELAKVTEAGYTALLSSCWYLNRIGYGPDWKELYTCDPQDFNGTASQKNLVIGGEFCTWGEYVDGTNLLTRSWPRGSAVAERLWSPASVTSADKATARLEEHRCRMIRRGYTVEPVSGPGFCDIEYSP